MIDVAILVGGKGSRLNKITKKIILNKNKGYGSAANLAISKIDTEYAFLLNPDVAILDDTIDKINNAIEKRLVSPAGSEIGPELYIKT